MVSPTGYVPDRGDFVWIDFSPHVGHEQGSRRPALVLSPSRYNRPTRLALFCPVTTKVKGYPWEVPVSGSRQVTGVVLADAVKNFDWSMRRTEFIERAPDEVVATVLEFVSELLTRS